MNIDELISKEQRARCRAPIESARTLPNVAFTSETFYRLEVEKIFSTNWVALDFIQLVPNIGDVRPVEVAGIPLVMLRDHQGEIRVFHNIVPYDGCLAVLEPMSKVSDITTPYHGWKYDLKGKLINVAVWNGSYDGPDISGLGERPGNLVEVEAKVWGPVIFVNIRGKAESFEDHVAPLNGAFAHWDLEALDISRNSEGMPMLHPENLATNWKTHYENWGINVLHESFVHNIYDASGEVPRLTKDGKKTYVDYIDGRFMALKYQEKDFQKTYPHFPFPDLSRSASQQADQGFFGSLFPNFHVGVFRTFFHLIISLPDGPGQTLTQRAQFYQKEAAADSAYLRDRIAAAEVLGLGGIEDGKITQAVQKARRSPAFESQYYSQFWDEMHYRFTQMVLDELEK